MNHNHPLRFGPDGTFRILQLADTQHSSQVSLDTVCLIDALLDATQPDLVVFTGDQIKGYARDFRKGSARKKVLETLTEITAPVRRRNIPFTATFGNHDEQAGLSNTEQRALYLSLGCLMPANGPDAGTFQLTVQAADGGSDALALYLVDSGGGVRGRYRPVRPQQTAWLQRAHRRLCTKNGRTVPGMVFQHIPVPEYYHLLLHLPCWEKGAVFGVSRRKGCFTLNPALCRPGGILSEAPNIPRGNSGEFAALHRTPGIFALFCGHDHRNTFSGRVGKLELGYTPSCGFDTYGPGLERGGRSFVFRQENPADFDTRVYTYRELVGRKPVKPVRNLIDSIIPANMDEAARSAAALALGAALLLGGLQLARRHRRRWKEGEEDMPGPSL